LKFHAKFSEKGNFAVLAEIESVFLIGQPYCTFFVAKYEVQMTMPPFSLLCLQMLQNTHISDFSFQ